jgi:hypothetical protein
MTDSNVIPFPGRGRHRAPDNVQRINELAQQIETELSGLEGRSDLPGLLAVVEQSSETLADLGALLLTRGDRDQMESVLASLDILIARTRDRILCANSIAGCGD